MSSVCSFKDLLLSNPDFKRVKSWYSEDANWYDVDMDLDSYRSDNDKNRDWYPSDDDKESFLSYVNYKNKRADEEYRKKLSRANNTTKRKSIEVYQDMINLGYNRAQLESRIDLIKSEFYKQVRTTMEFEKGKGNNMSLEEVVRRDGYRSIMKRVFKKLERIATPEKEYAYYVSRFGEPKGEDRQNLIKRYCEYSASEIKKLVENKEIFTSMAANAIGDTYGLSIDARGSEVSLDVINELNDNDDAVIEDNGGSGGDRYVDVRYKKVMETLSPEVKAFISTIPETNNKGVLQVNDLLRAKHLDPRQIAYILPEIIRFSTPDTFISDIRNASGRYPYLVNLADKLEGKGNKSDKDYAAMVYSNFKRAANTYGYIKASSRGFYTADKPNTRAHGNAIVRSMSVNVNGIKLDQHWSFYDNGGLIRENISGIKNSVVAELDGIKSRLGDVNNSAGGKDSRKPLKNDGTPTNYSGYTEYAQYSQKYGGGAAIEKFVKDNADVVPTIARALRGIGIDITDSQVQNAVTSYINKSTLNVIGSHKSVSGYYLGLNRLDVIVDAIKSVYDTAESVFVNSNGKKKAVARDVFDIVSNELVKLNAAIGVSFFDELEPRVLVDGSSLQTYVYPSLLHDTMSLINNEAGDSDDVWWSKINDQFLRYGDYTLPVYVTSEDGKNKTLVDKPVGWFDRIDPNRERKGTGSYDMIKAGDLQLIHMTSFNHVDYGNLSIPQKIAAQLVMWAKYNAVEVPIQADYISGAWDFVANAGVEPAVNDDSFKRLVEDRYAREREKYAAKFGKDIPVSKVASVYDRVRDEVSKSFGNIKDEDGKYHTEWPVVQAIADEVEIEINRINKSIQSIKSDPYGLNGPRIKTYDEQSVLFHIFPEMNDMGFLDKYNKKGSDTDKRDYILETVASQLEKVIKEDFDYIEKIGALTNPNLKSVYFGAREESRSLFSHDENGKIEGLDDPKARITLQNFFLDYFYGRLQMTKIISGGLHNFNGLLDYEKRSMMQHATRRAAYTSATWNGEFVGRENQNAIYLGDETVDSNYKSDFDEMLKALHDDGLITDAQRKRMSGSYNSVTTTDGQAFRTYESYRVVQIELGKWNDRKERVYRYLMFDTGFASKDEIREEMQSVYNPNEKPVYTGFEDVNGIKVPVLHKYSETVLFPPKVLRKLMGDNVPAQIIGMAMAVEKLSTKNRPIDIFLMGSCVKVGAHTIISPFSFVKEEYVDEKTGETKSRDLFDDNGHKIRVCKTADDIADYITASVNTQPWAVHTLSMKYYGEAASTPAHGEDDMISWSSQADKDLWGNIMNEGLDNEDKVSVNGIEMKASRARDINDEIDAATIAEKYKEIQSMFDDHDEMKDMLLSELAGKPYSSPELKYAIESGDVPYFYPSIARGAEQLFNSIIKKRLTRPRTKGANLLQITSLGYDVDPFGESFGVSDNHKLKIEFDGNGKDKRIKWVDCYIPIHDSRLEIFADETGAITPEMLWGYDDNRGRHHAGLVERGIIPEEMLKFVAYRTPSDEIHSIIPLRIKGFISKSRGANIIVPKEIMVMTGHDFDGDKLRSHFQDFEIVANDDVVYEDYKRQISDESNVIKAILNNESTSDSNDKAVQTWRKFKSEWLKDKTNYTPGMIRMHQYDYTKRAYENSQEARNNAKVQLAFAQLTSPAGSRRMIIPGGSADTDVFGATFQIVRSIHNNEELKRRVAMYDVDTVNDVTAYKSLVKKSGKELSKILDVVNGSVTPYTFKHSNEAFDYMIGGKRMISVYAIYASASQMLQRLHPVMGKIIYKNRKTNKKTEYHLGFFGNEITGSELYKIKNNNGNLGTLTESEFVNSAVDNGKNPRLGYLNQVPELAELTNYLVAANMSGEQVHLILNQPIVVEAVRKKRANKKMSIGRAIMESAEELIEMSSGNEPTFKSSVEKVMNFGVDDYASMFPVSFSEINDTAKYYTLRENQIALAKVLLKVNRYANLLSRFIKNTRPEATSNGISSTIAGTKVITDELDSIRKELLGELVSDESIEDANVDVHPDSEDEEFDGDELISNLAQVITPVTINSDDSVGVIADKVGKSKLSRVTSLEAMMQDKIFDMLSKYFPQAKKQWRTMVDNIMKYYNVSKREKESIIRGIGNEMILWNLLKSKDFTVDEHEDGRELIINMPHRLADLKERISREKNRESKGEPALDKVARSLTNNVFLSKLTVENPESESSRPKIMFQKGGVNMDNFSQKISYDWALMYASENDEIHNLAVDLYKYNAFTSGFGFGMYEFAHFAPFTVINGVGEDKGYLRALNSMRDSNLFTDNADDAVNFLNQYFANHWGDERLVKRYDPSQLPNVVREKIGLKRLDDKTDRRNINNFGSFVFRYITVAGSDNNVELYRVDIQSNEEDVNVVKVPKLGHRTKRGQVFVQYEPSHDVFHIEPHQVGDDSLWELPGERIIRNSEQANIDSGNDYMNSDEREDYVDSLGSEKKEKISVNYGKEVDDCSNSASDLLRKASKSVKANDSVKPIDSISTTQQSYRVSTSADELISMASSRNKERDVQTPPENIAPPIGADDMPKGFSYFDAEDGEFGGGVEMPYLEKKDNWKEVYSTKHYPWTPENVRKAREWKAYYTLNDILRNQIFPKFGIATAALTNADARLHRQGVVSLRDATLVNAHGLHEMIRLAEGDKGVQALPEEFAHLALEMLGFDNPLVQRLVNVLNSNTRALREAFGEQYNDYFDYYKGNKDYLVKEAAGKLLAKSFLREVPIETPEVKPLMRRIIDKIKELFRAIGSWRIWDAILDANNVSSKLARDILSGKILDEMSLNNISGTQEYASIQKDISRNSSIIHGLLQREVKRLALLQKRQGPVADDKKSASVIATEKQIAILERAIRDHKVESNVLEYMQSSLQFLKETEASLDEAVARGAKINTVCRKLNAVRDTLYSYASVMDLIYKAVDSGELVMSDSLSMVSKDVKAEIDKFFTKYNTLAMSFFERMLSNVYGEHGVTRTLGKHKGEQLTISEMARKGERDISLVSRMLSSLADCGDYVLAAFDDITRRAKIDGRNRADAAHTRIVSAFDNLVKATGSKSQDFMFEYKVGDDGKMHKTGKYIDKDTAKRSLSKAQLDFYNEMIDIKNDIDNCLPPVLIKDNLQIVALRKYGMDRIKSAEGIHGKLSAFGENVKNAILDTSDEADKEERSVQVDFQNNKIDNLPVKYITKGKHESWDDMTDDVAMSVAAYASMGYEYDELNQVIAMLENARYMSQNRDIEQSAGRQRLVERWTTGKTEDDFYLEQPFSKKQMYTNIQGALNDFFQMHLYGKLQKEEGGVLGTKLSKRKLANLANSAASYSQMAFNFQQRISNVSAGMMNIFVETAGKGPFNAADFAWATKEYLKNSFKRMSDTGKLESDNKLSLFAERYDLHQNNGKSSANTSFNRSRFSKVFNTNLLFAGLNVGEDFLALTTALAVAKNFKVKGPSGKIETFYDAFDVKYLDDANKTGAYLYIKDGYKMVDGSEITKDIERKYAKLVIGTNFRLQGIYNADDRSAIQQYAFGSLVMMYRKWMHPALIRRYGKAGYNPLTGEEGEGYWRTFAGWIGESIKDGMTDEEGEKIAFNIINYTKNVVASARLNWANMTDYEKSNVHRAMVEFSTLMSLCLALLLVNKFNPDKDDKSKASQDSAFNGWFTNMMVYQMFRLRNEMGSVAPTPLIVREMTNTLSSPVAAFNAVVKILRVPYLLWPGTWTDEIQSGPFKGKSKAEKIIFELPILSLYKQIQHVVDPTPLINYYKNDKH